MTSQLAFSNRPHCRFQPASLTFFMPHNCNNSVTSEWIKRLALFISYKLWQKRGAVRVTDPTLWRAAGGCIGERCMLFMQFHVPCNLKAVPNKGEVSFVSAHYLNGMFRCKMCIFLQAPTCLCSVYYSICLPLFATYCILMQLNSQ